MSQHHVGIGEYQVSRVDEDVIKTFALGSCVAVVMYDKVNKVAGMIHLALPDSAVNTEKAEKKPGYFVDTGLPVFLSEMSRHGVQSKQSWIKIVGGSSIMDDNGRFDIGKRNILAVKKHLWQNRLGIISEDVGGSISRTVTVSVATGEVTVSSAKKKWNL